MEKISVIIQGEVWPKTLENAEFYLQEFPFVDDVVISCWEPDAYIPSAPGVKVVRTRKFIQVGYSNCNYQLVSTINGLKAARNRLCVKTRSDQRIISLDRVYDHAMSHEVEPIRYLGGDIREFPVYCLALHKIYPFHMQDHLIFGAKPDMLKIFDIPLYPARTLDPNGFVGFGKQPREPIYIGAYYCSLFDARVKKFIDNYEEYLCDPNHQKKEVKVVDSQITSKIFHPLPRLDIYWEKFNSAYWFERYEQSGECYYEA